MSLYTLTRVAVLLVGCSVCPSLFAYTTLTWNFGGQTSAGTVGNAVYFNPTPGGPTIKATAWYLDASGAFEQAALGIYANGLGVCYPGENCNDPYYQTDDSVYREFILLESSELIDPLKVRITTAGDGAGSPSDTDVTYWLGSRNGGLNLAGSTVSGLSGLGFGSRTNNNTGTDLCNGCYRDVALSPTGIGFNSLLFGAAFTGGSDDYFTVTSLTGNYIPEPSSFILFGTVALIFIGLAGRARRRVEKAHIELMAAPD